MKRKYKQIIELFENLNHLKEYGVWLSGIYGNDEYKLWYDNGQLRIHTFYKFREISGDYKEWHKNGQLKKQTFFNENGKRNGVYKEWHRNGALYMHKIFKNGKEIKNLK